MAACWPLQMPPTPKAVLVSLADQANDQGYCWPSVATVCDRTCFGERAVRNAIRWLESQGLVRVEIGAMKANRYTVNLAACREWLLRPRHDVPPGTTCPPAPDAGVQPLTPARGAGQGGTTCPLTVIEPIPNTPPNPPSQGSGGDEPVAKKPGRKAKPLTTIEQWLALCKAEHRDPIPEGDPVFAYCDRVGISREMLQLHWLEFKRRRKVAAKRQCDWPQTFRNSVEGNWYRLWFIGESGTAEFTTMGRQARADWQAQPPVSERRPVASGVAA